jgi:hypothetical protein
MPYILDAPGQFDEYMKKHVKNLETSRKELIADSKKTFQEMKDKKFSLPEFIGDHFIPTLSITMIIYIIIVVVLYNHNPGKVITTYPQWAIVAPLVIGFIIFMMFLFIKWRHTTYKTKEEEDKHSAWVFLLKVFSSIVVLAVIFLLILFIFYLIQKGPSSSNIILTVIIILMMIFGLGIIYKQGQGLGGKWKPPRWLKMIGDVIFYIPCLFVTFIEYFKKQYKITTKIEWIILAIEILLILLGFLIPWLGSKIAIHDGSNLLTKKTYLDYQTTLARYQDLYKDSSTDKKSEFSYHYAISGWVYINPQPPSTSGAYTQDTSLINYGGKPNIMYNGISNTLIVKAKKSRDEDEVIYVTKMPMQKWNHIVINYNGGTLDVFLNNVLVASASNILPYMTHDTLTIGDDPGINGGVDDVFYFQDVLSRSKISDLYHMKTN